MDDMDYREDPFEDNEEGEEEEGEEEDRYYSGTGEMIGDESYERYLDNGDSGYSSWPG